MLHEVALHVDQDPCTFRSITVHFPAADHYRFIFCVMPDCMHGLLGIEPQMKAVLRDFWETCYS